MPVSIRVPIFHSRQIANLSQAVKQLETGGIHAQGGQQRIVSTNPTISTKRLRILEKFILER